MHTYLNRKECLYNKEPANDVSVRINRGTWYSVISQKNDVGNSVCDCSNETYRKAN